MPRPTPAQAAPARPRTWLEMRERIEKILERRTGEGIAVWAARVAELGDIDEPQLRTWLTSEGVTGYPQMVLVMERFGYPDFSWPARTSSSTASTPTVSSCVRSSTSCSSAPSRSVRWMSRRARPT